MISRRNFCKSLLAANLIPAIPPEWGKVFGGMDFGKDSAKSVWLRGGYHSLGKGGKDSIFWFNEYVSIPWKLLHRNIEGCFRLPKADLEGGRSSPKTLHIKAKDIAPKPREKSKREKHQEEFKWLWFEEASEFENWEREG